MLSWLAETGASILYYAIGFCIALGALAFVVSLLTRFTTEKFLDSWQGLVSAVMLWLASLAALALVFGPAWEKLGRFSCHGRAACHGDEGGGPPP